jgi:hypothetical protein
MEFFKSKGSKSETENTQGYNIGRSFKKLFGECLTFYRCPSISKVDLSKIMKDYLQQLGFDVREPTVSPKESTIDFIADKEGYHFIFDVKSPEQEQLTYDSIAQAKTEAWDYQKRYTKKVQPVIVGSFTVLEGPDAVAKDNEIAILRIPQGLSHAAVAQHIGQELTRLTETSTKAAEADDAPPIA